jgi:hypothetical protein
VHAQAIEIVDPDRLLNQIQRAITGDALMQIGVEGFSGQDVGGHGGNGR